VNATQSGQTEGDLAVVAATLAGASSPEAIFGDLLGSQPAQHDQLRRRYWQLALLVHPDRHGNDPIAVQAFVALQRLYEHAQARLDDGRYSQSDALEPFTLTTRRRTYIVRDVLAEGDFANLYTGTVQEGRSQAGGIVKIARDPRDNDLLANEARTLRHLNRVVDGRSAPAFIPRLLESFLMKDEDGHDRQVNTFPLVETERGPLAVDTFYSLAEIRAVYPNGVEAGHMAWIWRRLLIALGHAHDRDVIHGAVLPPHILVHPEAHGLLLVDWCASVQQPRRYDRHIPAISAEYERWYPLTVLARKLPTPAVDLEMALRSMVYLLGGDPLTGVLPSSVPSPIGAYLRGAIAACGTHPDVGLLYRDFTDLIFTLWGRRRFMPFAMPARR
jgi:hypothetical protein